MNALNKAAAAALSLSLLSGCVIVADGDGNRRDHNRSAIKQEEQNREAISRLQLGSSRESVLAAMGTPDFSDAFSHDESAYQIYYYRTHRVHADGDTTRDETTPLVFINDKLVGWGESALTRFPQR